MAGLLTQRQRTKPKKKATIKQERRRKMWRIYTKCVAQSEKEREKKRIQSIKSILQCRNSENV